MGTGSSRDQCYQITGLKACDKSTCIHITGQEIIKKIIDVKC